MLKNQRIIVTGAAGGIGRSIAHNLLEQGAKLSLFEKDEALCDVIRAELPKSSDIAYFAADLADPQAIANAVTRASENMGGISGLVNNAAILHADDGNPCETSLKSFEHTLQINVTGAFLMCKHVLPHMLANGGSIVTLSSVVARSASATPQIAYTTSKGALEAMTREIAIAYARHNIRANSIAPGPVLTERTAHYFDTEEKWEKRRRHIPAGRLGQTNEVASLVAYLLSPHAAYMTGGVYPIDGGISAAYVVDDTVLPKE